MTAVVIPWRGTSPERTQAKTFVLARLRQILPTAPIFLADSGHQPFNRAASRNRGVEHAANGVVVVCDADTIPEPEPLHGAIAAAQRDGKLHLPYTRYRALSPAGTTAAFNGSRLIDCPAEFEGNASQGGILVVEAEAWQNIGGMDERFTGWGFEDTAFYAAAHTLLGTVVRHEGAIHHLWHRTDYDAWSPRYAANKARCRKYEAAYGDPEAMHRITRVPARR